MSITARFVVAAFTISWVGGVASVMLFSSWAQAGGQAWQGYLITLPSAWGPALAAGAVTLLSGGWADLRRLLNKLRPRRADLLWLVMLPVLGTLLTWTAFALAGRLLLLNATPALTLPLLMFHLVVQLLVVGLGEELGWRGWLLPRLALDRSMFRATVLTGVIWLLWHLPKLIQPLAVAGPLAVIILSSAVLLSFVWLRAEGSVLVVAVAHVSINAPVYWVEWSGAVTMDELFRGWAVLSLIYLASALLLLVAWRDVWRRTPPPLSDPATSGAV